MDGGAANRPRPIMLKILPIMLLSIAQIFAQYYAHVYIRIKYC